MNTFPARTALSLAVLALAGAGCGVRERTAEAPATDENGPRFLSPPAPSSAHRRDDGVVELAGRAPPLSLVTLSSPEGAKIETTAAQDGGWTLAVAPADRPRVFALSSVAAGAVMRGEGAVLVTGSAATPAFLLRAGSPALTLGAGAGDLTLEALDFDSGGLAVAGHADPNAALRFSIDARPAAAARADGSGRFALLAVQGDLKPGLHRLLLDDGTRRVETTATTAPPQTAPAPAQVSPIEGGWRVDWATPGGGAQSSLIFSPPLSPALR